MQKLRTAKLGLSRRRLLYDVTQLINFDGNGRPSKPNPILLITRVSQYYPHVYWFSVNTPIVLFIANYYSQTVPRISFPNREFILRNTLI